MGYAIYADTEALLKKHSSCSDNGKNSYSKTVSTHKLSGFSITVVSEFQENAHIYSNGKDCMKIFSKKLLEIRKGMKRKQQHHEIFLTEDEKILHQKAEECYLCRRSFNTNKKSKHDHNFKKVKDHCYYTGKYKGAALNLCSSKYDEQRTVSIFLHNGSNYHFHLIISSKGI